MKIALVHDYLKQFGGAERVLLDFHDIWPKAPLYTLFSDLNDDKIGPFKDKFRGLEIHTTFFQKIKPLVSPFRFLIPSAWETFDFSKFDVVLSSSGWGMAYSVLTRPKTLHISYIHTPPRNLYGMASRMIYYKRNPMKGFFASSYACMVNPIMRVMDYNVAQRPDYFIANSENVRKRVQKFYNRDAKVIYPPVAIPQLKIQDTRNKKRGFYLIVSRLEPEKMVDLSIEACKRLNIHLKVVGTGTDYGKLRELAKGSNIEFLGKVTDEELRELYLNCKAFLLNEQDVDFGITSLEAQSYGRPVLAIRSGGFKETIIEGKTGEFYERSILKDLIVALKNFKPEKYNPQDCIINARRFSEDRFKSEIENFVSEKYAGATRGGNHKKRIRGAD